MGFAIFFGAILSLVINILIAEQFQQAADAKGFSEKKYFWICFFLGIVGYLLVIALPNKSSSYTVPKNKPLPNMGRM